MRGFKKLGREQIVRRMLKRVKAPRDLTLNAARGALQNEAAFKALSGEKQSQVLAIFDDEWSKVKGETISGVDVVQIPKQIHRRVYLEVLRGGET